MNTIVYASISTPVGPMVAFASDSALCGLEFDTPQRQTMLATRLRRYHEGAKVVPGDNPIIARARRWLDAYFSGRGKLETPPLDLRGTPFERRVWELLLTLPLGTRATYGELASRLGLPAGARAVGGASRRNPVSLIVPCHRVVGTTGALTGYGGGIENKGWLLDHERQYA